MSENRISTRERFIGVVWGARRALSGFFRSAMMWSLLGLLVALVTSVALWSVELSPKLSTLAPALLSINVAVAAFSANLSLAVPRSSAYRELHSDIPPIHLLLILVVLLLATVPIGTAAIAQPYLPKLALICLVLALYSSVGLLALVKYETSPLTIIRRLTSRARLRGQFDDVMKQARRDVLAQEDKPVVPLQGRPSHEFGHVVALPPHRGPLQQLEQLGSLAVRASDVDTYRATLEALLVVVEQSSQYRALPPSLERSEYKAEEVFRWVTLMPVLRLAELVVSRDPTGHLSGLSVRIIAAFLLDRLRSPDPIPKYSAAMLDASWRFGKHLLSLGLQGEALTHVIVARQLIEREVLRLSSGLEEQERGDMHDAPLSGSPEHTKPCSAQAEVRGLPANVRDEERSPNSPDPMQIFDLGHLTLFVRRAGEDAARKGATDFLYRCLEALSFTGCSAVAHEFYFLAKECGRGLCHLGRVARAEQLECHWDKCLLTPADHAAQNLGYMLSSVGAALAKGMWKHMFEELFSRLHGHECTVALDETTSPVTIVLKRNSDRPHKMSFASGDASRTIDFSDPAVLKDIDWL